MSVELDIAIECFSRSDWLGAESHCRHQLQLTPRDTRATNLLGSILHMQGRADEARTQYRRALEIDPSFAKAAFNLARIEQEKGNRTAAIEHLRQGLSHDDSDANDYFTLGTLLHEEGKRDEAILAWQRAVLLSPTMFGAWFNLGVLLQDAGRQGEAETAFERASRLAPESATVAQSLGALYYEMGNYPEAIAQFRNAARLNPDALEPYLYLSDAHRSVAEFAAANEALRLATNKHSDDVRLHRTLGLLKLTEGQLAEAAEAFRSALALLPDDAELKHFLASAERSAVDSAPATYVRTLFDGFAGRFDKELVTHLQYAAPKLIADALKSSCGPVRLEILDLGCGTGFSGQAVHEMSKRLVGVDLSPNMLREARAKNLYDDLVCSDGLAYLQATRAESFDAIIAVDVLIYVGKPDNVLSEAFRVTRAGGSFAFSLESATLEEARTGASTVLRPTGRFAHVDARVELIAKRAGWNVVKWSPAVLRIDHGVPTKGSIVVLNK